MVLLGDYTRPQEDFIMAVMTKEETEALIQEVLEVYPEKAKNDRAKHLAVNDQSL